MSRRKASIAALTALFLSTTAVHAGELHDVTAPEVKATVGAKSKASVVLTGKKGWHLNEQAPVKLTVTPPAGVTVDKPKLARKDLAEDTKDRARFDIAFTAAEPGKKTIDAEASFVICQEQACKPVKEKVSVVVDVAPTKK